eukprot:Clim_evm3s147 gene=Clim_evmTU3s147
MTALMSKRGKLPRTRTYSQSFAVHMSGPNGAEDKPVFFSVESAAREVPVIDGGKASKETRTLWRKLSFELSRGDSVAISGPSGAGKSQLLRCIAGLDPFSEGGAYLEGQNPRDLGVDIWRSRVVYIAQETPVFPGTPNDFWLSVCKFKRQKPRAKGGELGDPAVICQKFNLPASSFDQTWQSLSGGERQRVSLSLSLALCADVYLLDEPTSALDQESTLLVEKAFADSGAVCLWVSHSEDQKQRVSKRRIELADFRVGL